MGGGDAGRARADFLRACILIATANLRLRMQKPHVTTRLLGEALGEPALGVRGAGGDGFADSFPSRPWWRSSRPNWPGRCSPRPIGWLSRPQAEHETKCIFQWHKNFLGTHLEEGDMPARRAKKSRGAAAGSKSSPRKRSKSSRAARTSTAKKRGSKRRGASGVGTTAKKVGRKAVKAVSGAVGAVAEATGLKGRRRKKSTKR